MSEPTLSDNPAEKRFEVAVDGELAGFTQYRDEDGVRNFPHTEVFDRFGGRGLATRVIRYGLDVSRDAGRRVLPTCPAVAKFIAENPDYVDLVPSERRAEFDLA